jgi:capsular exopolysaccharide synthesis family protein
MWGDEMSMDRLNGKDINRDSASSDEFLRSSDPIARNDKDIDEPQGQIQTADVSRRKDAHELAERTMLLPDRPWGINQQAQTAPSATDLLVSILRFKWTILAVFVLMAAPIVTAIWTLVVPKYQARAEVRVRPIIPFLVFQTEDSGMIPLYDSFKNTQVSIIRSLTVLQRVLDQKEIQETEWYQSPNESLKERLQGNPMPAMERLRKNLTVWPRQRTELIDVSFVDKNAKDARLIVDTVLDQYIRYVGEMSDSTEDNLYRQLVNQYKSLENEIAARENIIAEISKSLGTQMPEELISSMRIRLDNTQVRLNGLRRKIAILEWEQKRLEDLMKQAITDDIGNVQVDALAKIEKLQLYHEDMEWRSLDINIRTLQHQIDNSMLTPKHPDMIKMVEDLNFAEDLLRLREAQLDEQWQNRPMNEIGVPTTTKAPSGLDYTADVPMTVTIPGDLGYGGDVPIAITGMDGLGYSVGMPSTIMGANNLSDAERLVFLQHQLGRTRQQEQLLLEEFKKQQAKFGEFFENAQLLSSENNALTHKRELFRAVRQRLDQKSMERNVPGSIDVLMGAFVSSQPHNDRRIIFTAMVLVMSLSLGCGAGYLRASLNQAIHTPKDIPHPTQVPFLGYIPLIRTKKSPGKSLCNEIEQNKFLLMESVRVVRTILLSRVNGRNSTTVLVTSAAAGTGKSSFTMMLGKSLAQVGKKVLIIDADFHKRSLTKQFSLVNKSGFMESLCSSSGYRRHIFPTETSGLSVMPVGKLSDNGQVFEETANGAFKACISQLRKQYNIILLDSPPILPVADAAILSNQVDGTIMVERELISRRSNVISAIARLDSAGGRLLGTVFIGSGGHGKYGYGYYYSKKSKA